MGTTSIDQARLAAFTRGASTVHRFARIRPAAACAAAVATASLAAAVAAHAFDQSVIPFQPGSPAVNGCPSGFEALALADLAKYNYHVPFVIDAGGNDDGVVCGKPMAPQEQAARAPDADVPVVFDFRDNDLNASGR